MINDIVIETTHDFLVNSSLQTSLHELLNVDVIFSSKSPCGVGKNVTIIADDKGDLDIVEINKLFEINNTSFVCYQHGDVVASYFVNEREHYLLNTMDSLVSKAS